MARRHHAMGGMPAGPIARSEQQLADWQIPADAINQTLAANGIRRTDETRRVVEDLEPEKSPSSKGGGENRNRAAE